MLVSPAVALALAKAVKDVGVKAYKGLRKKREAKKAVARAPTRLERLSAPTEGKAAVNAPVKANLQQPQHTLTIGNFTFLSQDPKVISDADWIYSRDVLLPGFLRFWKRLEEVSGHRWKCTSYIRRSPSHEVGQAIDLAPDIAKDSEPYYAVTAMSDPVLYKREPLLRQLQYIASDDFYPGQDISIGVFIEPDHLHVGALERVPGSKPTAIIKWGQVKPVYSDSSVRSTLPLTTTGYLK